MKDKRYHTEFSIVGKIAQKTEEEKDEIAEMFIRLREDLKSYGLYDFDFVYYPTPELNEVK